MVSLYCLLLEGGRYYVGKSNNIEVRLEDHLHSGGADWTILHKPVSVCEIRHNCDDWDEDKFVKQMMALHGVDKVRGGSYSQTVLPQFVKDLLVREIRGATNRCFRCGASDHFAKSCESVSSNPQRAKIVCFKCNIRGHYANECPHARVSLLQLPKTQPNKPSSARSVVCYACRQRGHYANVCPSRLDVICHRCGRRGHYSSRCPAGFAIVVFR